MRNMTEAKGRSAHRPQTGHLTFTIGEAFRHGPEYMTKGREAREHASEVERRKATADAIRKMARVNGRSLSEADALGLVPIHGGIDLTREA